MYTRIYRYMDTSDGIHGIVIIARNCGESNTEYYYRVSIIENELTKIDTITSRRLHEIDLKSKNLSAERLLGCRYKKPLSLLDYKK